MTDRSALARALAALRPRSTKRCLICEREFEGIATARTCSNNCRQQLYRNEKKTRPA